MISFVLGKFYGVVGTYFYNIKKDLPQTIQFYNKALELAHLCRDTDQQCSVLTNIAHFKWVVGDYCTALVHVKEAHKIAKLSEIYTKKQEHAA
jgi:hypothetical protein